MNTAIQKIREAGEYAVELVKATTTDRQPVFAYLLIAKNNRDPLRAALKAGTADLRKFGLILASGMGHNPATDVWDQVQARLRKTDKELIG